MLKVVLFLFSLAMAALASDVAVVPVSTGYGYNHGVRESYLRDSRVFGYGYNRGYNTFVGHPGYLGYNRYGYDRYGYNGLVNNGYYGHPNNGYYGHHNNGYYGHPNNGYYGHVNNGYLGYN